MRTVIAVAALAVSAGLCQALASITGRAALEAEVSAAALALGWGAGLVLATAPWWVFGGATLLLDPWWLAPAVGLLLLAGNLCLARALTQGSAGVVVPVLSSKVVLVAIGMSFLGRSISAAAWIGALLTCAGIATLGLGQRGIGGLHSIVMALAATLCYAGFDALVALHGTNIGIAGLLPAAACWALLGALPLLAVARLPARGRGPLLLSGALNGIQCLGLVWAIILAGDAVLPNILYGCRGIWSVLLLALLAAGSLRPEPADWRTRFAGAALIAAAIGCTLLG
jgi:drug/metabolite transporter (DMT)-like permease